MELFYSIKKKQSTQSLGPTLKWKFNPYMTIFFLFLTLFPSLLLLLLAAAAACSRLLLLLLLLAASLLLLLLAAAGGGVVVLRGLI